MFVHKIPINWKCPHCSVKLPEPGFWQNYFEGLAEHLVEMTAIFWAIVLGSFVVIAGVLEMVFSRGFLMAYITDNFIFSTIMIIFGAMVVDMYMKVVLPLQLRHGSDFIIKERKVIRNIRTASHLALTAGLMVCLVWVGGSTFFKYFPAYIVVIACFLALNWAVSTLFLDLRMAEDLRFRHYMDRLGITNLKRLRRIGTSVIALLFTAAIVFFVLMQVPNLWRTISAWSGVGSVIHFIQTYLDWLL